MHHNSYLNLFIHCTNSCFEGALLRGYDGAGQFEFP